MTVVISTALPLFLIILTGYLSASQKLVSPEAVNQLIPIVLYIFLPAFIFMRVMEIPAGVSINGNLLSTYYLGAGFIAIYIIITGLYLRKQTKKVIALRAMASVAGVVGYLGLPLIILALGETSALPALILVTADNLLVLVGGSLLVLVLAQTRASPGVFLWTVTKEILKKPLIMSFLIALLVKQWELPLSKPLAVFLNQFSAAASPCALFLLGCILANVERSEIPLGDISEVVVLKLLVFPLFVYLLGHQFHLTPIELKTAVLMAALPVAVNVFILANNSAAYIKEASTAMFLSTCLSVFTLSMLLLAFTD